jgi:hypothetical protein
MQENIDFARIFALTDEMLEDSKNKALDGETLRGRLRHYRSKINRELAAIVLANAKIE